MRNIEVILLIINNYKFILFCHVVNTMKYLFHSIVNIVINFRIILYNKLLVYVKYFIEIKYKKIEKKSISWFQ
jgi:hypothetical protein